MAFKNVIKGVGIAALSVGVLAGCAEEGAGEGEYLTDADLEGYYTEDDLSVWAEERGYYTEEDLGLWAEEQGFYTEDDLNTWAEEQGLFE
ncbi:hypothetical protein [Planococcus lenghuensis]|uniref:Uncharacterized protein n=1 Tax=Planococcus lenghuensis TaxID=2213202 RepID=A0A1Q2L0B7_9BACL|nr:hypothetical protein [Planococcus lenghuensis]AQQ53888.1 hypothetical protein B0X71_12840 [Planococcus lenghuensis]